MSDSTFERTQTPWFKERGLSSVLEAWRNNPAIERCLQLDERIPEKGAQLADFPEGMSLRLREALQGLGMPSLYTHQAKAFELASTGSHLVVATPTASGKSLCYNLPVLEQLIREPDARALYLFPTKALARDQEEALRKSTQSLGLTQGAITYDGDTPGDARRAAREKSSLLITNPDMLHAGILPHHTNWARFFASLRYVVIDELHMYRGVFGSHLSNVIRRLRRIARFHGSDPVFLFASATIGNPKEHASRMLGEDVALVDESGAPHGGRQMMVYNPPVLNAEIGLRASYVKSAVRLVSDLLDAEVSTILFGSSRNQVEVMLKYLRDHLIKKKLDPEMVQAYRSGYLPETRRRIERGLRDGSIRAVVSTNALELGIDIGSLDAAVCAGYPGTIASLYQRFGRSGRRQGDALSLLVTSSDPLDQFVAGDAQMLMRAPAEEARIDPDNLEILIQHLKCAAFELPFESGEAFGTVSPENAEDTLKYLERKRVVHGQPNAHGTTTYHWSSDSYPANHVPLRSVSWDNFVIIDLDTNKTIAEMDWRSTHTMLHVQAIYQHDGEQYQVEKLDFENHKAYIRHVDPDYYTTAMTHTKITVTQEDESAELADDIGTITCLKGEVSVIEKVVGYKKIKFHTHENAGYGDVHLPEMQMHTSALGVTFSGEVCERLTSTGTLDRATLIEVFRGIGQAMHTVATFGTMCDPRDLGHTLGDGEGSDRSSAGLSALAGTTRLEPTLYLFDRIPGGIGLAPRLYQNRSDLLFQTRSHIARCACTLGCPSCIGLQTPTSFTRGGSEEQVAELDVADKSRKKPSLKQISILVLEAFGIGEVFSN